MKIVYIASSTIPSQAANSIHIMKICQAFALNGHDVVLLLPNKIDKNIKVDDIYDFYGVKKCFKIIKIPIPKFYGNSLIFSFLSVLAAKKEKPDLIYTRFLYSCFFSLLFRLPTIFEIHSSLDTFMDKLFFKLINKNKVKKIVVISHALKNYYTQKYGITESKIFIAPDGADSVGSKHIKPNKIKKSTDQLVIGYVGHLYEGRGIEIIAELAKKCSWLVFHVIGGIPEDVNFWKNKLSSLKNVIFYGYIAPKEVYKYMLSFDALIAPYQEKVCVYGGGGNTVRWMSPLKIFEYMAVGKVILASDLPALREILIHNTNCLLARPRDISKWVSNLKLIKNDISFREKLGQNAKKDFEDNYTWKSRAENIIK